MTSHTSALTVLSGTARNASAGQFGRQRPTSTDHNQGRQAMKALNAVWPIALGLVTGLVTGLGALWLAWQGFTGLSYLLSY